MFWIVSGVALAYLTTCFFTVPQRKQALITFFGRHVRTEINPGLRLKLPWPFHIVTVKIPTDLRQVADTLDTKTRDNLFVSLPITIQYEIVDTGRFYFDTDVPIDQMSKIVSASVRKYTSGKDFQELYDERDEISEGVIGDVKEQILEYGINIRRIVVDEPTAPMDVQDAYNRVRASEREKDAAQNEAAADYIRRVKAAEADKQRNILIGEGVAGFRRSIAEGYANIRRELVEEGVDVSVADRFMEEAMRLDTIRDVGDKGNMVIVLPGGATNEGASKALTDLIAANPVLEKMSGKR
ncbi:MAG: SPFH domain-containing protein [Alphaproteobacteria bacterium]|jgi:regulator of protease activity HflC (stomatin/prohibitin superfamily)|nr:SPFH domain-containing protein [Alphaproteobacteria bacterium]MDP7222919.1 SPFH domain-containing protein [Alphaproteobacteria bacterium]